MRTDLIKALCSRSTDRSPAARYRFHVDVEIDWGSKVLWGRIHDISRTGMFIELEECPWISACFSARLALNEPLTVDCIVCRVVPGQGVGVTIAIPGRSARKRFNALLRALQHGAKPGAASAAMPQTPTIL